MGSVEHVGDKQGYCFIQMDVLYGVNYSSGSLYICAQTHVNVHLYISPW